jgi:hypothetical protein
MDANGKGVRIGFWKRKITLKQFYAKIFMNFFYSTYNRFKLSRNFNKYFQSKRKSWK